MAANIPGAIVAGGGKQRNPGETLLLGLAGQVLGSLAQAGMKRVLPQPITPAQQADFAVRNRQAAVEERQVAVAERDQTAEEKAAADAARMQARIRKRILAELPENLRPKVETLLDLKAGGMGDSSINDMMPYLLPPTEAQAVALAKDRASTDEINFRLRQARTDMDFRKRMAGVMGLPVETVTDGMLTEWMRQKGDKDAKAAETSQDMAERLLTTLISRSVVDPITGQANPAFSIEDAATRAEAGVKLFDPDFKLNLSAEQRGIAQAGGVLRAAVARLKMNDKKLKDTDIEAKLLPSAINDFPEIPADRLKQLITEAIKSNVLTGFGG